MSAVNSTPAWYSSTSQTTTSDLSSLRNVSVGSADAPWTPQSYVAPEDSSAMESALTSELDNGLDGVGGISVTSGTIARLDKVISCGFIPALVVLGTVGNCLCVAVFVKQRYSSVVKPLLLALCVSDIIFLLCSLLVVLSKIAGNVDVDSGRELQVLMTPQAAVLRDVMGRVTVLMTLAIGVERSVTVTRHFKMKALCTVPRTRSVALLVYVIVFSLMAPLFFRFDVIKHRVLPENVTQLQLRKTAFYIDNRNALDFYVDFILAAFLHLLPFVCMCTCFGVIVVSFKRRLQCRTGHPPGPRIGAFARARGASHPHTDTHADLVLEERQLTRALLAVLFICILCDVPGLVTCFVRAVRPNVRSEGVYVARVVSQLMEVISSAANFPVFMITYRQFSAIFLGMIHLCKNAQPSP